jgi:hypothetical protein
MKGVATGPRVKMIIVHVSLLIRGLKVRVLQGALEKTPQVLTTQKVMACGVLHFLTETSIPHQKGSQKVPKSAETFDAFCGKTWFYGISQRY